MAPLQPLQGDLSAGDASAEAYPLDWTHEPKRFSSNEGNVICKVSLLSGGYAREHKLHLVRTMRIEPNVNSPPSAKPPPAPGTNKVEQITVSEKDLLRYGGDLRMLRRCSLPPAPKAEATAPKGTNPLELSFKSAFARRCRSDATLRDPWKHVSNPEEVRDSGHNEFDRVLNQVWVKALSPRKLEKESLVQACDATPPPPRRRRNTSEFPPAMDTHAFTEQDWRSNRPSSLSRTRIPLRINLSVPLLEADAEKTRQARSASARRVPLSGSSKPVAEETAEKRTPTPLKLRFQSPIRPLQADDYDDESSAASRSSTGRQAKHARQLEAKEGKDMRALWVALSSAAGEVVALPRPVALRLEGAFTMGRSNVPLVGLGEAFESTIAYFGDEFKHGSGITLKDLDGGCRDVQRSEVPGLTSEVNIYVSQGEDGRWQFAEGPTVQGAEARHLSLTNEIVAPPSPTLPPVNPDRRCFFINRSAYDE